MIKTLVFMADEKPVIVLMRGNDELNEVKLKNYLDCDFQIQLKIPKRVNF